MIRAVKVTGWFSTVGFMEETMVVEGTGFDTTVCKTLSPSTMLRSPPESMRVCCPVAGSTA